MARKINKNSKLKIKYEGEAATNYIHKDGRPYEKKERLIEGDYILLNRVYIHTLFGTESSLVSYAATTNFRNAGGRKRILKPLEKLGWRNLNSYEEAPYVNVLKKKIEEKMEVIEKETLYGTQLASDNRFRIIDKSQQGEITEKDKRPTLKGRICESSKKPPIIKILLRENIITSTVKHIDLNLNFTTEDVKISRKEKITYLIQKNFFTDKVEAVQYTDKQIDIICKWYISNIKVEEMCKIIKNKFRESGRLLET